MILKPRQLSDLRLLKPQSLVSCIYERFQPYDANLDMDYSKSSIKPPGGLFNFRHSRGGLNREGSLITKSNEMDTN